jgi:hypothetical protein
VKGRVALFNMPAAGKCRKGVFRMKKLLLVMLVPILVLGVMGCGSTVLIDDGVSIPAALVGYYTGEQNLNLTLQGTQAALIDTNSEGFGNIVFAIEYSGPYLDFINPNADSLNGAEGSIMFKRSDDGKDIARIDILIGGDANAPTIEITDREIFFNYMNHMIPIVTDKFTRVAM